MKKIIHGVITLAICMGMVSCGADGRVSNEKEKETITTVTEPEVVVPEYNTFSMSVEEIVNKMNSSGKYTKTWSSDCTTQELTYGKGIFKTNDVILGCNWSGTYEVATNNIIDITISYPCEDNANVNEAVACATATAIMEYLFDDEDAMSVWMQASQVGSSGYDYGEYNIYVGYNNIDSAIKTIITPKNELK